MNFNGKIADTLAAAGHDVVVYQPVINGQIRETGSSHKDIRYYFKERNESIYFDFEEKQSIVWEQKGITDFGRFIEELYDVKRIFCEDTMRDDEILWKLRNEKFDLGITEIFNSCGFAVFHAIGLKKFIATNQIGFSFTYSGLLGIPMAPSFQASAFSELPSKMTFFQRVQNLVFSFIEDYAVNKMYINSVHDSVIQKYPDFNIKKKIKEAAFMFVNTDEIVDEAVPITSKLIHIGGLGKSESKPLDQKYQEIFNSSKKGVIYFSLGSVVHSSSMPESYKRAFLEAFAEFPEINFIWKYERESDNIAKDLKNVFTFDWLPQNDILEHGKLLAFISHAGTNSMIEGASKGVPTICVPVFIDQLHNAKILEEKGIAVIVNKHDISKKTIMAAIRRILENPGFKEKAKIVSKMIQAKPMTPEERVVKYAEFAAQFGDTDVFQSKGRHLNIIQLYSIDVIFFLVFVIVAIGYGIFRLVKEILHVPSKFSHLKEE
ncbi:hypothetical protein FO519_009414 [Halicephalobus sp. NKZ332]|nr:hypothetical protein FO519_009414 [Halicephalobus sp. NKZ332]